MSIETDADRLDIVRTLASIASDTVTVRVRGHEFAAIFDNGFADAMSMVEGTDPMLICRSSDLSAIEAVKDDVVEGLDQVWRIKRMEPDGNGMTRVSLRR